MGRREMLRRIDSQELTYWQAYFALEAEERKEAEMGAKADAGAKKAAQEVKSRRRSRE